MSAQRGNVDETRGGYGIRLADQPRLTLDEAVSLALNSAAPRPLARPAAT